MTIDFHTHIFPETIAARTMEKLKGTAGIEPAHDGTESGLLRLMDNSGVAGGVVLPVVTANRQFNTINSVAAALNEKYADIRERNTGNEKWLFSMGGIHPDSAGSSGGGDDGSGACAGSPISGEYKTQINTIKRLGLKGIKIHPDYHGTFINDIRYLRIFDYALEQGMWIVTHAGWDPVSPGLTHCTPDRTAEVLDKVPGERMILAHMGGMLYLDQVEKYIAGRDVWLDTSMTLSTALCYPGGKAAYASGLTESNGLGEDSQALARFMRIIKKHGAHRILWASDAPWEDQAWDMQIWEKLPVDEADKRMIMQDNALKILGL